LKRGLFFVYFSRCKLENLLEVNLKKERESLLMQDYRKQLMVAGQTGLPPGFDLRLTIDAQNYFAADYVDAWISMNPSDVDRADYLLVPGGVPDISPALYGEENKGSHDVDEELDRIQLSIIDRAVQQRKPILGICRGYQLVCAYFGGSMIQDLKVPIHHTDPVNPHFHKTFNVPGSYFYTVYQGAMTVNSGHHQALKKIPDCIRVLSLWCKDDETAEHYLKLAAEEKLTEGSDECVIEAVEHKSYPFLGLQFHPELGNNFLCRHIDRTRIRDYFYAMKYPWEN